jgi:hypothetical protein
MRAVAMAATFEQIANRVTAKPKKDLLYTAIASGSDPFGISPLVADLADS